MVWTPTSWSFQEIPSSAKMNATEANTTHVREEANYYPVLACHIDGNSEGAGSIGGVTMGDLDASVDSGTIAIFTNQTGVSDGASGVSADIDISSLSEGIHTINISVSFSSTGGGTVIRDLQFYFYKSPDMEYLTAWYVYNEEDRSITTYTHGVSITVIGHRETKAWTA